MVDQEINDEKRRAYGDVAERNHGALGGVRQIGVVENDVGRFAAKLERDRFLSPAPPFGKRRGPRRRRR